MSVTRFAPSPTGLLHLGHAFSALIAFDTAKANGGRLILRIEDTDTTRCKPEFEAAIYEDLAWLGIDWEEPVRRQSDYMADYAQALDRLIHLGVMYRCFKTRKDLMADIAQAPHGPEAAYRGAPLAPELEAQKLVLGHAFAWRLSLDCCATLLGDKWTSLSAIIDGCETKIDPFHVGDAVLARKEFPASYHLASVVDDGLQGITHIIRGQDLSDALHLHVLLQTLLGLSTPKYQHHRLILDQDGKRLAKRDQSVTLRALRDKGMTSDDIRAHLRLNR